MGYYYDEFQQWLQQRVDEQTTRRLLLQQAYDRADFTVSPPYDPNPVATVIRDMLGLTKECS